MYTNKNNTSQRLTGYRTNLPFYIMFDLSLNANDLRFLSQIEQMESNPDPDVQPYFSYTWIAAELGIDRRSAIRIATRLKKKGYLRREQITEKLWLWSIVKKQVIQLQDDDSTDEEDEFEPLAASDLGGHPPSDLGGHPPSDSVGHPKIKEIKIIKDKDITLSSKDVSDIPKPSLVKSKKAKPVSYSDYKQDERFMRFYNAYPRHKSPQDAYKAFIQLIRDNDVLLETIIKDIEERLENDSQWQDEQYIPYPATYLRKRVFEDEIFNAEKMRKEREEKRRLENEKRFKLQELANKQREELERMNNRNKVDDASAYKQTFTNNRFLEEMQKMKSSLRM